VAEVDTITREALKTKMDWGEDLVLLEVLGATSYERGHLPGAVRAQDPDEAEAVIPSRDAFVVAYCSNFH
jgi:rhodanese-related sulfurtransferase